jgi:hypothetical protein
MLYRIIHTSSTARNKVARAWIHYWRQLKPDELGQEQYPRRVGFPAKSGHSRWPEAKAGGEFQQARAVIFSHV